MKCLIMFIQNSNRMIEYPHRYRTNFDLKWGQSPSMMKRYRRAAIVPFIVDNNELYYIFTTDSRTGELSDFGGKRNEKEKNWFDTAIREFNEESYNSFKLKKSKIKSSNVAFDGYCVYAFVKLDIDLKTLQQKRQEIIKHYNKFKTTTMYYYLETSDITVLSQNNVLKCLERGKYFDQSMWMYIRHFFSNGRHWPCSEKILSNCKITHECVGDGSSKLTLLEFDEDEW